MYLKNIIERTIEFAKEIQKTKEYIELKKAKDNNDKDKDLKEKIVNYNILKDKIENLNIEKESEKEKIERLKVELNEIYKEIMDNENMKNYNQKSNDINNLMNQIHSILVAAVNGENIEKCNINQNYSCGSCGKCFGKK